MQAALVDTTVLYAAANRRAHRHDDALAVVRAADRGDLPVLRVPDPILVETANGIAGDVGHETAVEFLGRLRAGSRFEVVREPAAVWDAGLELFERVGRLSLGDALLVASARHHGVEYCYSFDDDLDGLDGLTRLSTAANPYEP